MNTSREQTACAALREYMRGDSHLFDKLRMNMEWDEREFQALVHVATRCLEEIEHDDMIPRHVASFFGSWLHTIKGMMRHPLFVTQNREGRTEQENTAYFDKRVEIIDKLVSWMSNGKRVHPPEHFVLPEWQAT